MGFIDLRQWMASLEQQGELRRVKAEVDWDRESAPSPAACCRRRARHSCSKTSRVIASGRCTKLFVSGLGSRARLALALGFRPMPAIAIWSSTS